MGFPIRSALIAAAAFVAAGAVAAQTTVVLPDVSQITTASVTVRQQAKVSIPAGVAFSVADVGAATPATAAAITFTQVVLPSDTAELTISLRSNSPSFTPPVAGATTWRAGDVSWNAAAWTAGVGVGGTLSAVAYTRVGTCNPGVRSCGTSALIFSLAPKPTVQRSGTHTLIVTWKLESIGS